MKTVSTSTDFRYHGRIICDHDLIRLSRGQTLVITVKICVIASASVKNVLACRNLLHPWE